ncbi:helix-turn-helix domain-containing protein [Actinomadura sp. 6N118]|uniref:helix-turn-helix domain-containing protein n=1 Tax=Actinomadura sp. 6N118 TaxID=3375151 RepID=UPI0037ADF99A
MVAAAHHISVRLLHKLFTDQEMTVADFIRHRRLERCRQDLRDPTLRNRPISSIGARHGLVNPAHFSRLFRDAYGVPFHEPVTCAPTGPHGQPRRPATHLSRCRPRPHHARNSRGP